MTGRGTRLLTSAIAGRPPPRWEAACPWGSQPGSTPQAVPRGVAFFPHQTSTGMFALFCLDTWQEEEAAWRTCFPARGELFLSNVGDHQAGGAHRAHGSSPTSTYIHKHIKTDGQYDSGKRNKKIIQTGSILP